MSAIIDPLNSALRRVPAWLIYVAGAAYAVWLFYLGFTGQLGAEPINRLERAYGELALKLIVAGLLVTPLRRWPGLNLMKFRRAIGVTAFFLVLAHFLVWVLLDLGVLFDVGAFSRVWEEIVKRPYITVGFSALVLLIPAVVTSNNYYVRRLGPAAWKQVHKLTYPAAILAAVHYLWLVKGFQIEPIVYLVIIGALLGLRYFWSRTKARAKAGAARA